MMLCWVILLVLTLGSNEAYKFLVHSPIFGYSHTNFMGVIADTLTEAGHDVTVLMPVMDGKQENMTGVKLTRRIIKVPPDPRVQEWMKYESVMLSEVWTMQTSVFKLMKVMQNMTASFVAQCEAVINDDRLMKQLAEEKFDVGISETFDMCGLGIFEALKIPSSIATFSGVHMDVVSKSIGEPIIPSYVPGTVVTTGDRMNFIERLTNAAHAVIGQFFFGSTFAKEEILADASYVFTNSNPYLDYPRPMLHKTVPIGGITVHIDPKKNILPKVRNLVNSREFFLSR
ncbi:unnamed protein product [Haemonchus placei]|uniref:glucuronosyltransferase n=1 Tax=Haemonchus placei TaxID=6290 RepID=A0A158QRW2_HAEPC|nr:unnamed protein product [Haemonchus placei]